MKKIILPTILVFLINFSGIATIAQTIKTVGAGGDYETLYEATVAIKNGEISGEIVLNIISDITETIPSEILASGQKSFSYTSIYIKPTGISRTISANFSDPIITIDGGDNITFDGRVDGVGDEIQLTFQNADGSVFHLNNDASRDTIKYCSIKGNNSDFNKGLITLRAESEGCSNILIDNCNIGDETLYTVNGIYAEGTGVGVNSSNTISACSIFNFWSNTSSSCGIYLDDHNSDWDIKFNNLYQTNEIVAAGSGSHYGIYSLSGNGLYIYNNNIGGSAVFCGGSTPWKVTGNFHNTFTGIFVDSENIHASDIIGNTVGYFSWQPQLTADAVNTPGVWCGIRFTGGTLNISENCIGSNSGLNSVVVKTYGDFHVSSFGIAGGIDGANITISGNDFGAIDLSTNNLNYSHSFIGIQNDGASTIIIQNNNIGNSTAQNINASTACTSGSNGQHVTGIINNANTTTCNIENNNIFNLHNATVGINSSVNYHQIRGIVVKDGSNSIKGNYIKLLTTTSKNIGTEGGESVIGISVVSDKASQTVEGNIMHNLSNTSNDLVSGIYMSGIYFYGPTSGINNIRGNQIYGLYVSSTLQSAMKGINILSGKLDVVNNMISIGGGNTGSHTFQGIHKAITASENINYFNNSVVISGTATSTCDVNTYAFMLNWTSALDTVMNNIFVNTRVTSSGAGKNYAFYKNNSDAIPIDYNSYYATGTGTVLGLVGGVEKTELPMIAGLDQNSMVEEVSFTNSAQGNLHTSTSALNAKAFSSVKVATDFDGQTRNPLFPDIGADEFSLPTIEVDPTSLVNFGLVNVLDTSAAQSYSVNCIDLSASLTVTAPTNYVVSLSSDADFGGSLNIAPVSTNIDATIYARFAPQESGFHLSTLANSSTGATSKEVNVSGTAQGVLPLVSSSAATSLTTISAVGNGIIDHTGGDNATTRGVIVWPFTGTDLEIGGANVVDFSENGNFAAGNFNLTITDLLVNTRYNFRSYATNPQGTTYGETLDFWTLANVPSAPTISEVTSTTVNINVNENLNPVSTQFALYETTTSRYVQSDGSMNTSAVWQTKAQWGTKTVTLYDLQGRTGNRQYIFEIKAKNGADTQTAFGGTTSILTLANTPNIMWVGNPTSTTISVAVYTYMTDYSGNTAETLYAIEETNTGKFLQADGTLATDTTWNTRNNWDVKIVTGLSIATEYNFRSIATNDNDIRTSPGPENNLFTLAVIPGTPILSSVTETTAQISVNQAANPTSVEFAIASAGGVYVQSDGTLAASSVWQTKAVWDGTTIQGLSPNAIYSFSIKAQNGDNIETDFGEATSITTLANVPLPPTLYVYSYTDRLMYYLIQSGNPEITEFAVQDSISGKYLQSDGFLSETAEWKTKNGWEVATQYIIGLLPGTEYAIRVKARNSSSIETNWGLTSKLSTLPNVPGIPIISSITTNSVDFEINPNDNPEYVTFAAFEGNSSLYVQEDGTLAENPVWQIVTDWGTKTIIGLNPNQSLSLKLKAKNGDGAETYFSEPFSCFTYAITPASPTVEVVSTTNVSINVNPNGNPNTVYYAIQEVTTGQYIHFYNGLWFEEDWRTDEFWSNFNLGELEQSTEYSFRVKARNSDLVETAFGPETTVTTLDGPPVAPVLIAPENGSTNVPNSIVFSWNASSNADTYSFQLSLSGGFYDLFFEEAELTETTIQVDNLTHEATYYWRVNATNANGTGEWSSVWSFTTEQGYPPTPNLIYPANGAVDIDFTSTNLSWNVPSNTEGFRVQVSLISDFSTFEIDSSYNLTNWNDPHNFYLFDLTPNTTYYWRVSSLNSFGASPWSDEWSFTTKNGTGVPATTNRLEISIFPNPAGSLLYINGLNAEEVKVKIFSELGVNVLEKRIFYKYVDIKNISSGIYMIIIETPQGAIVRKFVKQ